ncbi:MAG: transposase [Methanospirillum sp.]|uniref:transposase n=1 Tax=Methanospirillum sp. TaxID=45200 RepID=UPI00237009CC|nr:transposase [Methanospirillum sp.]MDD1727871.1 transposase [Methanospirillum sp.]
MKLADREDEFFWRALFEELKERGLTDVQMVISDGHKGIQAVILKAFTGVSWQMYLVHFMRAILRNIPVKSQNDFRPSLNAAFFKNNGDLEDICEDLQYHGYHKAVDTIERSSTDIHIYRVFQKNWKKISTTNMMERVNKKLRDVQGLSGHKAPPPNTVRSSSSEL